MDGEVAADTLQARESVLLRGRVAVLYTLSQHYLFLPFAVLCMAAAIVRGELELYYLVTPFVLLIAANSCTTRLRTAYEASDPNGNPEIWATRFVLLSGVVGAIWGAGAIVWFDFKSFPAEAYLVLAYLGLSATEFVARAAYRQAYLAHAVGSLGPLAAMLLLQGGVYQILSALLVMFFAGVLYSYGGVVTELIEQSLVLRHDNQELIARLSAEKRLAEETRDAAEANERAKSAFISNISHELRTPLNAILGMAQLLERSDLEKAQRDHVKVLLEAGRGLKTLLDDIIVLASQNEVPLSAPEGGCDAAQPARTVARLLQPNAWEKRLRLSVNIASTLPHVAADPRLLRRVLLKLVGNAIKYTDRGNVEIALDAAEDSAGRNVVRFAVTDTGPGIPHHLLSSIFEPFGRADASYASRHAGSGVGLAVVKRLVESAGGTIGVESELGMGASFWITIPATGAQVHSDVVDQMQSVAPPAGLALLAFVPDGAMRTILDQLLSPFGNRITFAGTLAQAATMSSRGGFGAILTVASSADALAAAPGQRTSILALALGNERPPDGADGLLRWPATPEALYAAVQAVTAAPSAKPAEPAKEMPATAAIDAKAIAELEKSLGFKTLIDILQSYLHTAEQLAAALAAASQQEDWGQASRIAQDFAGAAGGLGLTAITSSARILSQAARDGGDASELGSAAGGVISEHHRVRDALRRLYPGLAA